MFSDAVARSAASTPADEPGEEEDAPRFEALADEEPERLRISRGRAERCSPGVQADHRQAHERAGDVPGKSIGEQIHGYLDEDGVTRTMSIKLTYLLYNSEAATDRQRRMHHRGGVDRSRAATIAERPLP
jgi:hypothetical protein